jgi:5-(carboxyamino)imidazole ribonucleotide mutase
MAASMTPLPVLGVPVESKALSGQDSLLSIVQMPGWCSGGNACHRQAGAINAAILAASRYLSLVDDEALAARLDAWRADPDRVVAAASPKDEA